MTQARMKQHGFDVPEIRFKGARITSIDVDGYACVVVSLTGTPGEGWIETLGRICPERFDCEEPGQLTFRLEGKIDLIDGALQQIEHAIRDADTEIQRQVAIEQHARLMRDRLAKDLDTELQKRLKARRAGVR